MFLHLGCDCECSQRRRQQLSVQVAREFSSTSNKGFCFCRNSCCANCFCGVGGQAGGLVGGWVGTGVGLCVWEEWVGLHHHLVAFPRKQ